jgi:hypothetical protein
MNEWIDREWQVAGELFPALRAVPGVAMDREKIDDYDWHIHPRTSFPHQRPRP